MVKNKIYWIDRYLQINKVLPDVPVHFRDIVPVKKVDKKMPFKVPSGQLYNSWTPTQRKQWEEMCQWCDRDPEDFVSKMKEMLPKQPRFRK